MAASTWARVWKVTAATSGVVAMAAGSAVTAVDLPPWLKAALWIVLLVSAALLMISAFGVVVTKHGNKSPTQAMSRSPHAIQTNVANVGGDFIQYNAPPVSREPAPPAKDVYLTVGISSPSLTHGGAQLPTAPPLHLRLDQLAEAIYSYLEDHPQRGNRLLDGYSFEGFQVVFGSRLRALQRELEELSLTRPAIILNTVLPIDSHAGAVDLAKFLNTLAKSIRAGS
jgi:hypothetical protein